MSARALLVALCVTFASVPCLAQSDAAASRSVEKANSGLSLFEQGKWQEALALFQEADALYHSPVFVLYAARSLERAGRWTAALAEYERLSAEKLPASAPKAWVDARAEGRVERDSLEAKIPRVVVDLVAAPPGTQVRIDDRLASAGSPVRLDPGSHRVVASRGAKRVEQRIELAPGAALRRVVLRFRQTEPPAKSPEARGKNVPALVVGGAGAAALLAGGVVGIVALNRASEARDDFPESCVGSTCPASRRGEVEAKTESARTLGSVSNGLLLGGAVALAAGVVWWMLDPGAEPRATARGRSLELEF